MTEVKESIEERCRDEYESRLYDVQILTELNQLEDEYKYPLIVEYLKEEYGDIYEYGLWAGFQNFGGEEKYFCYQFCWGSPQSELRIDEKGNITFWFLDWGEGYSMCGDDFRDFIEYVTEYSIREIQKRVLEYIITDSIPKGFN
jgi:hypothetical protein